MNKYWDHRCHRLNEEDQFEVLWTSCQDNALIIIIIKMKPWDRRWLQEARGEFRRCYEGAGIHLAHDPTGWGGYWGSNPEPSWLEVDPSAATLTGAVGVMGSCNKRAEKSRRPWNKRPSLSAPSLLTCDWQARWTTQTNQGRGALIGPVSYLDSKLGHRGRAKRLNQQIEIPTVYSTNQQPTIIFPAVLYSISRRVF